MPTKGGPPHICSILLPHVIVVLSYESNNLICIAELSDKVCVYEKKLAGIKTPTNTPWSHTRHNLNGYGEGHTQTISAKYHIGLTLERLGKYEDSKYVLEEVVRAKGKSKGKEHLSTLQAELSLALAYETVGDYESASTFSQHALAGSCTL
jgi:hypothetical protein